MGIFGNSTNEPVPVVDHSAAGPAPAGPSIDGVIAPPGGSPAPVQAVSAPAGSPAATNPGNDTSVGDFIMTDPPAGAAPAPAPEPTQPAEESSNPAFNPHIGAPSTTTITPQVVDEPAEPVHIGAPAPATSEPPAEDDTITPAYPGMDPTTPAEDAEPVAPEPAPAEPAPEPLPEPAAPMPSEPAADPAAPAAPTDLAAIKQQALQQLSPLVNHLNQTPEEKFNTTMMMLQATDDEALIPQVYEAAQAITDDKVRAQAFMDIINEINYFTKKSQ